MALPCGGEGSGGLCNLAAPVSVVSHKHFFIGSAMPNKFAWRSVVVNHFPLRACRLVHLCINAGRLGKSTAKTPADSRMNYKPRIFHRARHAMIATSTSEGEDKRAGVQDAGEGCPCLRPEGHAGIIPTFAHEF